ncbi:(R)-mandelonitrile lyase [Shimia sediminis]|uniref:(R)-mandelonitrile lyase n=1 Tax=Shimia sediminis TaxID=2497945 RepID=UPI000F8EFF0B|nr:cupin domain-containing protein [Shimia sediminis]
MATEFFPAGMRPSRVAPENYFTGCVRMDPVIDSHPPSRVNALRVTFEPGARTAWHTHPLGQTLHVLSGVGLYGVRGERPRVMRAGDTVWIEPGVEHWHGAAPNVAMEHLAIQEALDGSAADWLEHVTDQDYLAPPA